MVMHTGRRHFGALPAVVVEMVEFVVEMQWGALTSLIQYQTAQHDNNVAPGHDNAAAAAAGQGGGSRGAWLHSERDDDCRPSSTGDAGARAMFGCRAHRVQLWRRG
jgi:hypothetical protein